MKDMEQKKSNSYLFGLNAGFLEELYDKYLNDATNLDPKWKNYFDSLQDGGKKDILQQEIKEKFVTLTQKPSLMLTTDALTQAQAKVWQLIAAYRKLGMIYANLDPLKLQSRVRPTELDIASYNLTNQLDNEFYVDQDLSISPKLKLKDILTKFEAIYCSTLAFEFAHITDSTQQQWLTNYVETKYLNFRLTNEEKLQLLQKLTEAEGLERYLHTKYVGQKRFSLEGGESLIPALDRIIHQASQKGIKEMFIGMAHRGRLNTLVNIMGKEPKKLFAEFEGNYPHSAFVTTGDVKYHKGYKCNYTTKNGVVKTTLAFNPSHLEIINPVLNGMVRATQDKLNDPSLVLGVLIHGDSALSGLGTNQGVLNMAKTRAYQVEGMLHIVVNNQIGFTNSDILDNRSSRYCTDIAKMIEAPIIHINADDVEGVAFAMDLAMEFKATFNREIMLDLVCFRRYGHNEADDPTLTQPLMYRKIKEHPGIRKLYANQLVAAGVVTNEMVQNLADEYRLSLNEGVHPKANLMQTLDWYQDMDLKSIQDASPWDKISTMVDLQQIAALTQDITSLPSPNFKLHPTLVRLIEARKAMGKGLQPVDFGMAETLAYASLLQQGISVRISGEDSGRGTFSHRHAIWHDITNGDDSASAYIPLTKVENNSHFHIYDSILNEECVMGFEYGYSSQNLRNLVIWEAQYGDFANGAQVVIDQFIASGEAKWGQLNGLTLLLPHSYDGQGPEHSSARIERFLQLSAENNMQIVIPSTAAQMFHLLRRKGLSNWVKPLVIFMSKRLLRFKEAMSNVTELANGGFKPVISDASIVQTNSIDKVILCSGQVYYDLCHARLERKLDKQVAILRIEQLYPFPLKQLQKELAQYTKAYQFIWAQEEPYNQGAWLQLRDNLDALIGNKGRFKVASRPAAAAPAVGISNLHVEQLKQLMEDAFA